MKISRLLVFFVFIFGLSNPYAQESNGNVKFKMKVVSPDNKIVAEGFLADLKSHSISLYPLNTDIEGSTPVDLNIEEIKRLKFKNRTGALNGLLIRSSIGILAGFVSGPGEDCHFLNACTPISAGTKALRFGGLGAIFGGIFGALLGTNDISLNGNLDTYKQKKAQMYKYLY